MQRLFRNSFLAGMFIAIAAMVYLMSPNNIIGSFFFSLGLLGILTGGFALYTGYVGYIPAYRKCYRLEYFNSSIWVWLGNLLGALFTAALITWTPIVKILQPKLDSVMMFKYDASWFGLIVLGFFCGLLMFTAVNTWKYTSFHGAVKSLVVVLCVMVFINCKFEHCVANMGYCTMYWFVHPSWLTLGPILRVLVFTTMGNLIGCCFIPMVELRVCANYSD